MSLRQGSPDAIAKCLRIGLEQDDSKTSTRVLTCG